MVVVYLQLAAEMELVIQQKSVVIEVGMQVVNVQEGMEFAVFVSFNQFRDHQNFAISENFMDCTTY